MSKFKIGDAVCTTPEFLAKYGLMAKGNIVEISNSGMLKLTNGEWYHERDLTDEPCTTPVVPMADMVNHPPHYTSHPSGIECIQVTEHMSFTIGNAVKYLWRADLKNGLEDLKKAAWYIQREIERREREA
ncbi:DUF3310 domain-containing protein [Zhongshania sp.]|uniref:DUF3310 domain-containing protein n=1 Tax=Zhongshania sp. TaxID=1971902 RepID=UPI00356AA445